MTKLGDMKMKKNSCMGGLLIWSLLFSFCVVHGCCRIYHVSHSSTRSMSTIKGELDRYRSIS